MLSCEIELLCVWERWFSGMKSARCARNRLRSTLVTTVTLPGTRSLCHMRTVVIRQRSLTPARNRFRLDAIVDGNFEPLLVTLPQCRNIRQHPELSPR
jgi:hypothetical protein